jgi:UV-stimulated scaffold protein A
LSSQDPTAKDDLLKTIISLKDEIRDATRKSTLLGIDTQVENANKAAKSDDEDDEDIDALFEEVEVPTLDEPSTSVASDRQSAAIKSKKLPPVQRVFPLAHEPHMADDATYTSPLQAQIERTDRLREK